MITAEDVDAAYGAASNARLKSLIVAIWDAAQANGCTLLEVRHACHSCAVVAEEAIRENLAKAGGESAD